jgi:hypothetical protein
MNEDRMLRVSREKRSLEIKGIYRSPEKWVHYSFDSISQSRVVFSSF